MAVSPGLATMTTPLSDLIAPLCASATESGAELILADISPPEQPLVRFHGQLEGPFCVRSRTLRTVLPVASAPHPGSTGERRQHFSAQVADPCYWTPELPFTYELTLTCELAGGATHIYRGVLGLRRFQPRGASFFLSGARVVLRGVAEPSGNVDWDAAAAAQAAVIVPASAIDRLGEASRRGVMVLVDFRGATGSPQPMLRRLAWEPAAVAALFASPAETVSRADWPLTAAALDPDGPTELPVAPWVRMAALELPAGARPPASIASYSKPVIVIRRGAPYADFIEARAACDRLQAELAPEFNLAGYFVSRP